MNDSIDKLKALWKSCWYVQFLAAMAAFFIAKILWDWAWSQKDPAAWAQAIGSIIGIGIAIYVPRTQRLAEIADRREIQLQEERALGIACISEIEELRSRIEACLEVVESWAEHPEIMSATPNPSAHLELGFFSELDAIQKDWARFKAAPQCLQRLIYLLRQYYEATKAVQVYKYSAKQQHDKYLAECCIALSKHLRQLRPVAGKTIGHFDSIL